MISKLLKIFITLLVIFAVTVWLISRAHPIILKWVIGSARDIGKPVNATVYTNGKESPDIKVYKVDNAYWDGEKTNDYVLSLNEFDVEGMLKFINIDLKEKWVGRPICTNTDCYDFINGYLFQSETGGRFADFRDDMKGYNFNPQLNFTKKRIKFNVPPNQLKFDSIRIELK